MSDAVDFIFRLVDRSSGPASRIQRAITRVEDTIGQVTAEGGTMGRALSQALSIPLGPANALAGALRATNRAARELSASRRHAQGFGNTLSSVASAATSLPSLIAGGAVGLTGKMVLDAVMFKENTLTAFETLTKSRKLGEDVFRQAVKFAADTPFETETVIDAYQKLLAFQFKPVEVPVIMSAVGDLAALKGFSKEVIDGLTMALGQIRAKGKLQGEELMQIAEKGVSMGRIMDEIGKKIGKSRAEVQKMISAGQIGGDLGIFGILETIRKDVSGGKLGNLMQKQSGNLGGMLSTLSSRPMEIFMDLDTSKGVSSIKRFIGNLNDATDTSTDLGKKIKARLMGTFDNAFQAIFDPLAKSTGKDAMSGTLERLLSTLDRMVAWWKINGPAITQAATSFGRGMLDAFMLAVHGWNAIAPMVNGVIGFVGGLLGLGKAADGSGNAFARLLGFLAGGAALIGALNWLTFGLAGAVLGLAKGWLVHLATLPKVVGVLKFLGGSILSLGQWLWFGVRLLGLFGMTALRMGAQMAAAWLIGLGPIGWVALAIVGIGAALVLAYNKVGWFRDGVNTAWAAIKSGGQGLVTWFMELPAKFAEIGGQIMAGLRSGILNGIPLLGPAITTVANALTGGAKKDLEIHSPSRVFAELGKYIPAGLGVGIDAGASQATRAIATMAAGLGVALPAAIPLSAGVAPAPAPRAAIAAPAPAAVGASFGGGGGSRPIEVHVHLNAGGAGGGAPTTAATRDLTQAAAAGAREGILEAFEQLAMEEGFNG